MNEDIRYGLCFKKRSFKNTCFLYINQKRTENKIRQIINCFLLIHKHLWFNILKQQTKAKNHFFY